MIRDKKEINNLASDINIIFQWETVIDVKWILIINCLSNTYCLDFFSFIIIYPKINIILFSASAF